MPGFAFGRCEDSSGSPDYAWICLRQVQGFGRELIGGGGRVRDKRPSYMWYVYALQSIGHNFLYVGHTNDVGRRVEEHNDGMNPSTRYYAPFFLATYVAVTTERKAIELEKYFKTGSGKAILKKRFLDM